MRARGVVTVLATLACLLVVGCGETVTKPTPDPYTEITPPFSFAREETADEIICTFEEQNPPLEISSFLLSVESANVVLRSLGLPVVSQAGRNVEHLEYPSLGGGRIYRTHYKWESYSLGTMVFIRKRLGSRYEGESYDSLDKIKIEKQGG